MNSKLKKTFKYILISLVSLLLLIFVVIEVVFNFILTPDKITPKIIHAVNENLDAKFDADRIELSFFASFPNFTLEIENGSIIKPLNDSIPNHLYTKKDTLISFHKGKVTVNPTAFIIHKKIDIKHIIFNQPQIYTHVDKNGTGNWDIVKDSAAKDTIVKPKETNSYKANIDLDDVTITKGRLYYDDQNTDLYVSLENMDLKLKARYNQKDMLLDLKMDTEQMNFFQNGEILINNLNIGIAGNINVNREEKIVNVTDTKVRVEDIEFLTNGQLIPDKTGKELDVQLDLALNAPSINSIVQLIPDAVLKRKNDFNSNGTVNLSGKINGIYGNGKIPVIQADFRINNGQLAYNNMPKKIDLIEADISLFIDPSKSTQSYINILKLNIKGDKIDLQINGKVEDVLGKTKVNTLAKGTIDFNSLSQTFPLKEGIVLEGKLETNMQTTFYPKEVKKKDYSDIIAKGKLVLTDVKYHYKTDSIIFESKNSKLEFIKDIENEDFTSNKTNILGGRIDLSGIKLMIKDSISVSADHFLLEYGSAGIKDTTQIALIKSTLNIENAHFNLKDTIKGMILKANGKIVHRPSAKNKKIATIHSDFFIDSVGIKVNNKFFAITSGNYNIDLVKKSKKRWPVTGEVSFNKMYAFTPLFPLLLKMPETKISIKPGYLELKHAKITLGKSDLILSGKIIDFDKTLFENKDLIMKMAVNSNLIDVNELIETLNKGARLDNEDVEKLIVETDSLVTKETAKPKTFVIPKKIDFEFNSSISKVLYKHHTFKNVRGLITVKNQIVNLGNLQMQVKKATMTTKVRLTTKENKAPDLAFDFKLNHIDIKELINMMPVLDSLLPMAKSFGGVVNFRVRGTTKLNQDIGMIATSLASIARIEGKNMVVMDSEAFTSISKKLMFKNKEKNIIDEISVEILIKDKVIEVLPAQVSIDRYKIAVGGKYNLDQTYNYQFSILKSPLPFKAGIDMIGDEDDYKFKLTKAKYKYIFSKKKRHSKKVDSTLIKKKIEIIKQLPF